MSSRQLKTEQLDMDSFFDFNAGTQSSPAAASSSKNDLLSPFDPEERQQFNGPSHDYGQFKQQVGLPGGSMHMSQNSGVYDGFNSGIDMDFGASNMGWNTGLDLDADMNMDFSTSTMTPAFFPNSADTQPDKFVNPNNVAGNEEPASSVGRLWPGMHSQQAQQAAMQKAAQVQAVQQRQLKIQAQQAQYRHASHSSQSSQDSSQQSHTNAKRASHITEPHVEESISRLLHQMRHSNASPSDDPNSPNGIPASIARLKKDEEDMDEDERLLASDEGKKLSSKERRQLRNKVSARAFRSRRKEYISQLEGEVALKTQEANTFRHENQQLIQENERYRGLIETLLRHPAFTPFIHDISQDPSVLGMSQQVARPQPHQQPPQPQPQAQPQPHRQQPTPNPSQDQSQPQQDIKPDFMSFDPSQIQIPQQPEQLQVGLTMVPDNDFSKLNLNGFKSMNFNNFNVQSAYAVTGITAGPDPVDLLIDSPARLPDSVLNTSTPCSTGPSFTVLLAKLDATARRMKHHTAVM